MGDLKAFGTPEELALLAAEANANEAPPALSELKNLITDDDPRAAQEAAAMKAMLQGLYDNKKDDGKYVVIDAKKEVKDWKAAHAARLDPSASSPDDSSSD